MNYTLDNGLDVILHQENSSPVVTVSVCIMSGLKMKLMVELDLHIFEHLLFEGTKNIERGKWFDIVSSNGGSNNANTSHDRTYYYETFPSNSLELGLWMESEKCCILSSIRLELILKMKLSRKKKDKE